MKTYKRGILSFIWSLFLAIAAGVFLFFVVGWFTDNAMIIYGISGAVMLIYLYMTVFSENIKFEIEEGKFRYYKRNKIREDVDLTESYIGYNVKTSDGSADHIYLYINTTSGEEKSINCTPLGVSKFYKMFDEMKRYAKEDTQKLNVKNKDDKKLQTKKKEEVIVEEEDSSNPISEK